jgi:hypothetical protein
MLGTGTTGGRSDGAAHVVDPLERSGADSFLFVWPERLEEQ